MKTKKHKKKNAPPSLPFLNIHNFKMQALNKIQHAKQSESISNQYIADQTGLHFQTIRNTLTGKSTNLETVIKILTVLKIHFHLHLPENSEKVQNMQ
jgi:DNA-binding phage protein